MRARKKTGAVTVGLNSFCLLSGDHDAQDNDAFRKPRPFVLFIRAGSWISLTLR
jgi:hypothetical protein